MMFGFLKRINNRRPPAPPRKAREFESGDDDSGVEGGSPAGRAFRVWLTVALIVVVAGLAGHAGLEAMRRRVETLDRYWFDASGFRAADNLPEWIRANPDLVRLVESGHGLRGEYTLYDDGLCERIRANYEANPWVRRVLEVRAGPSGIDVRLELRRPVAGVAYNQRGRTIYTLVDQEGIRLPGASLEWPIGWMDLPLVAKAESAPPRPGCRWEEAPVLAATAIACQLDRWAPKLTNSDGRPVRIATIDIANHGGRQSPIAREIVLVTREGARVLYGRSPLEPFAPGEASPEDKMRALAQELRKATNLHLVDYIDVAVRGSAITRRHSAASLETASASSTR